MLEQLRIENFALVDKMAINFGNGFNVITGETGAGKSLVVEALGLLLGERASTQLIRSGFEKALVEGYFTWKQPSIAATLASLGFDTAGEDGILLSREISLTGKNYSRINGKIVPLTMYQQLGNVLVEIHGQNEQLNLLTPAKQLFMLDKGGGADIALLKTKISNLYQEIAATNKLVKKFGGTKEDRLKQKIIIEHHLEEIKAADLKVGEEEELLQKQKLLVNSEKLIQGVTGVYEKIFKGTKVPSAYDQLGAAISELENLSRYDQKLNSYLTIIGESLFQLEGVSLELQDYLTELEYDPQKAEELIRRQDLIAKLKGKFGPSITAILAYQQEMEDKLEEMAEQDSMLLELQNKINALEKEYFKLASELSVQRKQLAQKLEKKMQSSLQELDMDAVQFTCKLTQKSKPDVNGQDEMEFFISPNLGEPLKPLAKIASGGEMARIMLALEAILADVEEIESIVFDEADSGIGGRTSLKVGKKLAQIAKNRQVICITHSPQIASFADFHITLQKKELGGRTITEANNLLGEEKIVDIARMLGGSSQNISAMEHARQLISANRK
ncbi:MAG: DNA repair protein RecN [Bacillota bacterium]